MSKFNLATLALLAYASCAECREIVFKTKGYEEFLYSNIRRYSTSELNQIYGRTKCNAWLQQINSNPVNLSLEQIVQELKHAQIVLIGETHGFGHEEQVRLVKELGKYGSMIIGHEGISRGREDKTEEAFKQKKILDSLPEFASILCDDEDLLEYIRDNEHQIIPLEHGSCDFKDQKTVKEFYSQEFIGNSIRNMSMIYQTAIAAGKKRVISITGANHTAAMQRYFGDRSVSIILDPNAAKPVPGLPSEKGIFKLNERVYIWNTLSSQDYKAAWQKMWGQE